MANTGKKNGKTHGWDPSVVLKPKGLGKTDTE